MYRIVIVLLLVLSAKVFAQEKSGPGSKVWLPQVTSQAKPSPSPAPSPVVPSTFLTVQAKGDVTNPDNAAVPVPTPSPDAERNILGGQSPALNVEEITGVGITKEWERRSIDTMNMTPGNNGNVEFEFGESLPTIVCAILELTDIQLQPGETIPQNGVHIGDAVRWSVESTVSNSATGQPIEHLIVKPSDVGLETSLVVTTDRRTYHILLISHKSDFFHAVSFIYHDGTNPTPNPTPSPGPVQQIKTSTVAADPVSPTIPPARRVVSDDKNGPRILERPVVDDSYRIDGRAKWRPVQVYNNGKKTYIEIPQKALANSEAPALFIETKKGWFHHEKILVNYRVHGRWYVVDSILDKATLVAGVGANQQRVDITHIEKPKTAVAKEN